MGSRGEVELESSRTRTKPMERTTRPAAQTSELKAEPRPELNGALKGERPTIKTPAMPAPPRTRTGSVRSKTPTAESQGIPPVRPRVPNAGTYSVMKQRGQEPSQPFERIRVAGTKPSTSPPPSSPQVEVIASGASLTVQIGARSLVLTRREAQALVDKLRAALK